MTDERITDLWAEAFRGPEASGIRFAHLKALAALLAEIDRKTGRKPDGG